MKIPKTFNFFRNILYFIFTVHFSLFAFNSFSQGVSINTNGNAAHNSAMLDVSATNQGMRIPRVALTSTTDVTTIQNPVNSLFVYDSATAGDITPGFYYWDAASSKWIKFATGGSLSAPGPITGTTDLCAGATDQIYSVSLVTGANNYIWSVPAGANITAGQGSTTITLTFGNNSGNICVTANNTSATSLSSCIPVNVELTATPGNIIGPISVYPNQTSVSYSIPEVPGAISYTWSLPTGTTITSGVNTTDIVVDFACNAISGNIGVTATTACGTGSASILAVSISTLTANTLQLVGGNTVLGGSPTATGGTAPYSYAWSPSEGLSNPTIYNPTAPCAGVTTTYTVLVTDSKNCTATNSVVVSRLTASAGVNQSQPPCATSSATIGGSPATAIGGTTPYTYLWSATGTTAAISSSTTIPNPTVVAPTPYPSNYTVTVTDIKGCTATSSMSLTIGGTILSYTTPGSSSWTVPAGISCILIETWGAAGGRGSYYSGNYGKGGYAFGLKSGLTGGSVFNIYVGGVGGNGSGGTAGSGGWNGGGTAGGTATYGSSGGGGGGASDVRLNGIAFSNRIIVGGGGAGAGSDANIIGGIGGYPSGGNAGAVNGGTQSSGNALGTGGNGAVNTCGAGGGGGGYWGGGGGLDVQWSGCSGGGGGSSYIGGMSSGTGYTNGAQYGNGQVKITY